MQNKTWLALGVAVVTMSLAGCEWGNTSSGDSVNSRYDWANFNGVYRGDNGAIVSDYTISGGSTAGGSVRVSNERVGTGVSGQSKYSGTVAGHPVEANSFQVRVGVFTLADIGGGVLSGSGKTGHISYDSGAWSIDLAGESPSAGAAILASYAYTQGASVDAGGANSGVSGNPIYTFNVNQDGNSVTLTDNNGAVYKGKIKSVRTSGGMNQDNREATQSSQSGTQTPNPGEVVTANFEVSGTSAAGKSVKIVGAFAGLVGGNYTGNTALGGGTKMWLQNRRMDGTWIESNGKTGNVAGSTPSSASIVFVGDVGTNNLSSVQ